MWRKCMSSCTRRWLPKLAESRLRLFARFKFSKQTAPGYLLTIGILSYTCLLTYVTWVQYEVFRTPTFDMGTSIQIAQTILQLGFPYETANWVSSSGTLSFNFFGIHFSPVRYLFAAAYWIYPGAASLLFVQALFVALGCIPTYKLALHILRDKRTSLLVSAMYLLIPLLAMSNLYDVHEEAFIPFALLWAYYLFVTKQYYKSIGSFVFMGLIQESVDILIFFAALQLAIINIDDYRQLFKDHKLSKKTLIPVCLMIAAPIVFLLENHLITTINPTAGFIPTAPQAYAISPLNILRNVPQKIVYWLALLALTGFLPLQRVKSLVLVLPWLIVSLFGGNADFSVFFFQYNFIIVPALIIGAIYGLEKLHNVPIASQDLARALRLAPAYENLPTLLLVVYLLFTPFYPVLSPYLVPGPHLAQFYVLPTNATSLEQLFEMIPSNATVLASDFLFAHAVRGINSYPLLPPRNFTTGVSGTVVYLPINFTPDYIVVFPSDFNITQKSVKAFPGSYGLVANVTATFLTLNGFDSFQTQKVAVVLYQYGYTGPAKLIQGPIPTR